MQLLLVSGLPLTAHWTLSSKPHPPHTGPTQEEQAAARVLQSLWVHVTTPPAPRDPDLRAGAPRGGAGQVTVVGPPPKPHCF